MNDQLGNAADPRTDHRATERIGLEHADRRVLVPFGGEHQRPRFSDQLLQLRLVQMTRKDNLGVELERELAQGRLFGTAADQHQALARKRGGAHQRAEPLLRRQPPCVDEVVPS